MKQNIFNAVLDLKQAFKFNFNFVNNKLRELNKKFNLKLSFKFICNYLKLPKFFH